MQTNLSHLARLLPCAILLATSLAAQQPDRTEQLLQRLADAPGPSGFEEPVRALMAAEMKPFVTVPIHYDGMGSLIAQQGATGPRIMIDAHMDELGGMVRRVTPGGFLTMQMLGGWLDQALVDQRWIIIGSKGPVHAVTGIRDIHVLPADERTRVFSRDQVYLDVGAKNPEDVAGLGISPGDPVVPDSPFLHLNGTGNYLAKAWDDRIGLAVLVEAMRRTASLPTPISSSTWRRHRRRLGCAAHARLRRRSIRILESRSRVALRATPSVGIRRRRRQS